MARVTVEDNGPGIPPENLESIFERFYTERPSGHFGNNSGLGLSIARQITQNAGGRIWARIARTAAARASSSNCRCCHDAKSMPAAWRSGKGVLLLGPSGAGKSDLALRLMDGGARLVADDRCELFLRGGHLHAPGRRRASPG